MQSKMSNILIQIESKLVHVFAMLGFLFCVVELHAQGEQIESQEIIIIKDYKVNLEDAVKVGFAPNTPPSENFKTEKLTYSIPSKLKKLEFEAKPIQPLSYTVPKLIPSDNSYLKLGFGSQIAPMAEWVHTQKINDKILVNAHAVHNSAFRSDALNGYQKFMSNDGMVGMNYHSKKWMVAPSIYFKHNNNHLFSIDDKGSNKLDIGRNNQKFGLSNKVENLIGKQEIKFSNTVYLSYLKDNVNQEQTGEQSFKYNEYRYGTTFFVEKGIAKIHKLSGEFNIDLSQANVITKNHRAIFSILPKYSINLEKQKFKLFAGLNFTKEINQMHILPVLETEKNLIGDALIFYTGWNIKLQVNYYDNLIIENPYLFYTDNIKNTKVDNRYGGFKGLLGKLNYNLMFSNRQVNNMPLYLADTLNTRLFTLQFEPRMGINNLHVAFDFELSKKVKVINQFDVYLYDMNTFKRAWNKPTVDLNIGFIYKPFEKWTLRADFFVKSGIYTATTELVETKLPTIIDLNVSGEYQFNKHLHFFLQANNVATQKYRQYYGYNNYGIQVFGGIRWVY